MGNITADKVTIRPAGTGDLDAMNRLLYELFTIEKDFIPDSIKQRCGLNLLLSAPNSMVLVADYIGDVVGMCTVQLLISTAEGSQVGLIEDVVVRRDYRRQGIGRRLLDAAYRWALDHGMSRLQLLTDQTNVPALTFYDANGWHRTSMICLRMSC